MLVSSLSCSRYDYEECDSKAAESMMEHVRGVIAASPPGTKFGAFELAKADDFEYTDPIDGSVAKKQGLRFVFTDGSRIIFRWVLLCGVQGLAAAYMPEGCHCHVWAHVLPSLCASRLPSSALCWQPCVYPSTAGYICPAKLQTGCRHSWTDLLNTGYVCRHVQYSLCPG